MLLQRIRKNKEAYLWMLPAVVLVFFSTLYPLFFSVDYSLWKTQVFEKQRFVWFENYGQLFADARFWQNIANSLFFTFVGIVLSITLGFVLALLVRRQSKVNAIYRTIILVPWVTNEVVLGLMWIWLLNPQMSPLYYIFQAMGTPLPNFFEDPTLAIWTVSIVNAWRSLGFSLVMMLAALSAIPAEVEEAAEMDGCGRFRKILHVIIPLVRPTALVMAIVLTISFFNIVAIVLTMTGGGPIYSTEIISIRLYKEAFLFFNIQVASTLTTIMLVINLGLAWIYKRIIRSEGYY